MVTAPQRIRVSHASVSDAKKAYFTGDFVRCLEICAAVPARSLAVASEISLLTARAYLRTGRATEAEQTVRQSVGSHATLDAMLTAEMLVAAARIRQDDPDTGLAILLEAAPRAVNAHFAIRSEIAYCTALGYWTKRDLDRAESYLDAVDPRSDIIFARALELRGWCSTARQQYRQAADWFRKTLLNLSRCKAQDWAIAANAISTLATYAAELLDFDLAVVVEHQLKQFDWGDRASYSQWSTLLHRALYYEFIGDTVRAYEYAADASRHAPTNAYATMALCASSLLAAHAGENILATVEMRRALNLLDTLDRHALRNEERLVFLSVAQTCVSNNVELAAKACEYYDEQRPLEWVNSCAGDPRMEAEESYVTGLVFQAQGKIAEAEASFRFAFETFSSIGYTRRAIIVGAALLKLSENSGVREYIGEKMNGVTNYLSDAIKAPSRASSEKPPQWVDDIRSHPKFRLLTLAQQEVAIQVCEGKTNQEIAEAKNVAEQTVKNMLTKHIFPVFGVSSRSALTSVCLRRSQPASKPRQRQPKQVTTIRAIRTRAK